MSLSNEDDVKKALGIESWRNLSKDKVVQFAAMMPEMSAEVSTKLIEQFPKFAEFAIETVQSVEREHESTLQSDAESEAQHEEIQLEVLRILKDELDKDLPADERIRVTDYVKDISDKSFEKDSEKKRFLESLMDKSVFIKGVSVAAAVIFVGGKIMLDRRSPRA